MIKRECEQLWKKIFTSNSKPRTINKNRNQIKIEMIVKGMNPIIQLLNKKMLRKI